MTDGRPACSAAAVVPAPTARTIKLNSRAVEALQRQRAHTQLAGGPVFNDPRLGRRWVDERAFRRSFRTPTLKRLGIRYRRPSNMRHTCATTMLMAGMNPAFCARQLGHSVEMFHRTYAKWLYKLLRVDRGIYVAPVSSRFGTRAPAPEKVVQSLAVQSGEVVTPHGANAANALGLTQQVPIREVYLTSGRSRKLRLGRYEVTVKHAPRWMLALGGGQAGSAVRALASLGPTHVRESLAALRRTLPSTEWQALTAGRAGLPSWMARAIGEEATRG